MRKIFFILVFIGFALAGQAQTDGAVALDAKTRNLLAASAPPQTKAQFLQQEGKKAWKKGVGYARPDGQPKNDTSTVRVFRYPATLDSTGSEVRPERAVLKRVVWKDGAWRWQNVPKKEWVYYISPSESK